MNRQKLYLIKDYTIFEHSRYKASGDRGCKLQTRGKIILNLPPISRLTANMLRCCCYSLGENIREDMTAKSLMYRIRGADNKSHFVQFLFSDESLIATIRILDSAKRFTLDIGKGESESNHPKIMMRELLNLFDICYRAACIEAKRVP